jgi:hypothetical protein
MKFFGGLEGMLNDKRIGDIIETGFRHEKPTAAGSVLEGLQKLGIELTEEHVNKIIGTLERQKHDAFATGAKARFAAGHLKLIGNKNATKDQWKKLEKLSRLKK